MAEQSEDEHFFYHSGRRWRKTDPTVPEPFRSRLVKELMSARRAVKAALAENNEAALAAARRRVNDAKVALGERGYPWWETPSEEELAERVQACILALARGLNEGKTICPSEVARTLFADQWRDNMELVRDIASSLAEESAVEILQKGQVVKPPFRGPIRIRVYLHDN